MDAIFRSFLLLWLSYPVLFLNINILFLDIKCQHFIELARMTKLISVTILKKSLSFHKYPVDNLPMKEPDLRDQTYFVRDLVRAVALTIFSEAEMEELSNQLYVSTLENAKRLPI